MRANFGASVDPVPLDQPSGTKSVESKIEKLRQEIVRLNAINTEMMENEDGQISLTDPDARSMAMSGKDTGIVGYNVQIAVDTRHHSHVGIVGCGSCPHDLANLT